MAQRELHALKRCASTDEITRLLGDPALDELTRVELLTTLLPFDQPVNAENKKSLKEIARERYRAMLLGKPEQPPTMTTYLGKARQQMQALGLDAAPTAALAGLPAGTVALEFTFTLDRPYISRDDDALYIIDNPVRKDKVFGAPYAAASSWKGSLRRAVARLTLDAMHDILQGRQAADFDGLEESLWPLRLRDWRLFGNENEATANFINWQLVEYLLPPPAVDESADEEIDEAKIDEVRAEYAARAAALYAEIQRAFIAHLVARGYRSDDVEGRRGRLVFFPTYFDRLGLEIINPHERERKVGKPVYFECVPAGAQGRFTILYAPFDAPGSAAAGEQRASWHAECTEDLTLLAQGLRALLYTYGFGAKTSSGYGTAAGAVQDGSIAAQIGGSIRQESFTSLDALAAAVERLAPALEQAGGGQ